jgi:uncharacterized protein (DUF58 family)
MASAANPAVAPALIYTAAEALWSYIKFVRNIPTVEVSRTEAVAGRPTTLKIKIETKAPAHVELPNGETTYVDGEATVELKTTFDMAGVYTPALTFTHINATKTVRYRRAVRLPPIYVISRAQRAIEYGIRTIAAVEEVSGAREYAPGDPLKRLHWKKMAKLLKPVIKQVEGRARGALKIAVLLYATTPKAVDKVLEASASAIATALTYTEEVEVWAMTRRGVQALKADKKNYQDAVKKLVAEAEALDTTAAPALDLANLIPKATPPPTDILIGERALAKPLCRKQRCILV